MSIYPASPDPIRPPPGGDPASGHLSEMFCSIQGEGPFIGERQIFVRTAGCSATCSWCDTVYSKMQTPRFVVHDDGKETTPNPVGVEWAAARVLRFAERHRPVRTVSITGGEPLEQAAFVTALARFLHASGLRVYLETNGVHAEPLRAILPYVGVIAMDVKLPSAIGMESWDEHRRFLDVVRGTDFDPGAVAPSPDRVLFVKVVVDSRGSAGEIERAVDLVAGLHRGIPLVLQPESETLLSPRTPRETTRSLLALLYEAQRRALRRLDDVRVMPQCHKIIGVR